MKRFWLAVVMNVLVPGTGLIALGRSWLGLAIAVWFGLGAEVSACGALIAPATIPLAISMTGAALAGAAWLVGQGLLVTRIRFLRDPSLPGELALLRQLADEALARGDHKSARSALLLALSLNDSDLATRILWARLLTASAGRGRARRAWIGAARLDADQEFAGEIRLALARLDGA